MRLFSDWSPGIKGPLGTSSLREWADYASRENFLGEETPLLSHVSQPELIVLSLRTAPGLVALSILWVLFLLGLVFGFTLLTLWGIQAWVTPASSTAAWHVESDSAGSTGRRPYYCHSLQCEELSSFSAGGRSSLKYETQVEETRWAL